MGKKGLVGSALDHRPLLSEGCFIFDFASLTMEVHLAYHVHKSGRKKSSLTGRLRVRELPDKIANKRIVIITISVRALL